jgi:isoleucyl-tRNA synthetase
VTEVEGHLDALDSPLAAAALRDFADVLTNWYVRRSRDRFWAGTDKDAFDTLFTVLETLARVAAPLAPLVTEEIWKGLTGGRSVHLADWPDASAFPADDALVDAMDAVRAIASSGLALRKATGLRVRLPLARLTVVAPDTAGLEPFRAILGDELNVKDVALTPLTEESLGEWGVTRKLTVNARAAGPRIGKQVQQVIPAAKKGEWEARGENVVVGGIELLPGEFTLELAVADPSAAISFVGDGGFVLLDTATTPELEAEGLARDVVRAVQQARRTAGLDVGDRVVTTLVVEPGSAAAIEAHRELIAGETLTTELVVDVQDDVAARDGKVAVGSGAAVTVEVRRA